MPSPKCRIQGRTLQVTDPFGMQIELYFKMEKRERLLQLYGRYHGVHAQRLDHFNVFSPELQDAVDFYALLGFRMTEYTEEDGAGGRIIARVDASQGQRPRSRLHQRPRPAAAPPRLLGAVADQHHPSVRRDGLNRLSRRTWSAGRDATAFPTRSFFMCAIRTATAPEFYSSDYQTMDPDHEPLRWSVRDPRRQTLWGQPAPRTWFEEGSAFAGTPVRDALFRRT